MTRPAFSRFDAVEYLKTDEDIALYLDACMEDDPGDGRLVRVALGDIARVRGMSQLANDRSFTRGAVPGALRKR
jgi:probable addiction module antidote protein